jgi:hypothetical protein
MPRPWSTDIAPYHSDAAQWSLTGAIERAQPKMTARRPSSVVRYPLDARKRQFAAKENFLD